MPGSCDPFRQNHKRIAAEALLKIYENIDEDNLFLSIGKITKWASGASDDSPPSSIDSIKDDTDFWRGIFAHNEIIKSDINLVVKRYDWKPGVIYESYDDSIDLYDDNNPSMFYVLVDEERVYKCIDNAGGNPSFVAPLHTTTRIRKLSDGYSWKFLYQIPETKRKFLTKTQTESIGYMPVEYIPYLRKYDERILQWQVQEDAVPGEISFIRLDPEIQPFVISSRCLFPSADNTVISNVSAGLTSKSIDIVSPGLFLQTGYYTGMTLVIDSGVGSGQRRVITGYTANSISNSATVSVSDAFNRGISGGNTPSTFSIVPTVLVIGDGESNNTVSNPYSKTAQVLIRFGATASSDVAANANTDPDTSCSQYFEVTRLIDSIDLVDGGKNYTFADLDFSKGLVVPTGKVNIEDFARPIMSPFGGHGSDPVKELGASSLMIVKSYSQTEKGKVSTENEFRQVGIIVNPLLQEKQARLRFFQSGLSGTFGFGQTAQQQTTGASGQVTGYTGAYGKVISWARGTSGHSGTSELVLSNVSKNGDFKYNGTVGGLKIWTVETKTIAGSEARRLLKMKVSPTDSIFNGNGTDFIRGYVVHGIGDYSISMPPSRATGVIYSWEPELGTNKYGNLYLENIQGNFKYGERITQLDPYYSEFMPRGISGVAKIIEFDTFVRDTTRECVDCQSQPTDRGSYQSVYDQTTSLVLLYENPNIFSPSSFTEDDYQLFNFGVTSSASGYVMDWSVGASGTTGVLRLSGTQKDFNIGMQTPYRTEDIGITGTATITNILHVGELKYRSGETIYIQNTKPIQRGFEQKEEIKIVIDF